jgi:hypothetical protein
LSILAFRCTASLSTVSTGFELMQPMLSMFSC